MCLFYATKMNVGLTWGQGHVCIGTNKKAGLVLNLGGVPQSSCKKKSFSRGSTPHKVGEEKCEESKSESGDFGKD